MLSWHYEFWTLDGRHLENYWTFYPDRHASELASFHGVDADEVVFVLYDAEAWQ
jgi:hypothetical protein